MADIFSKEKRSDVMRQVKSSSTKPEILVRKFLFKKGFRYRINDKSLPGTPDIKLSKYNCLIFVHGCFWHGHYCRKNGTPKSNVGFWVAKIDKNKSREIENFNRLEALGWRLIVIWECDLKKKKRNETLDYLISQILDG